MWSSPLFWMAFAIVLFWALGAYNRLMRLRSAVAQAFGGLDAHMVRLVALLSEFTAAYGARNASPQEDPDLDREMAALQGATTQLSACLAVVRAGPMAPDAVAALSAARGVLQAAWQGTVRKAPDAPLLEPHGSNGGNVGAVPTAIVPPVWQVRWAEHALHNDQAARVFNDAVAQYNAAIGQFPASVLAWVFGFKAARGL